MKDKNAKGGNYVSSLKSHFENIWLIQFEITHTIMSMLIAKFSFATFLKLQISHEIIYLCLLGHLFPYAGNGYVSQDGDLIQCVIPMTHHFLQSVCVKVVGGNAKVNTFVLGKSTFLICLKAKNYYNPSSLCQGKVRVLKGRNKRKSQKSLEYYTEQHTIQITKSISGSLIKHF